MELRVRQATMSLQRIIIILVALSFATSLVSCAPKRTREYPELQMKSGRKARIAVSESQRLEPIALKVVSLNLAHGRKRSINQIILTVEDIKKNLDAISSFLKNEAPDIIALQEADAPSNWSGKFNHIDYLSKEAGYDWYVHSVHSESSLGNYGTAILSRVHIKNGVRHDFVPTPPSKQKGFTAAEILLYDNTETEEDVLLDVVSVHLDFFRKSNRTVQMVELEKWLEERNNPVIIMGDFNADWHSDGELLQKFINSRHLKVYAPEGEDLATYKSKRLDWIFISDCLDFKTYYSAGDILSDHQAVISEIIYSNSLKCRGYNE